MDAFHLLMTYVMDVTNLKINMDYTFIFGDIQFPHPQQHNTITEVSNYIIKTQHFKTDQEAEEYAEQEAKRQASDYIIKELYAGDIQFINLFNK